MNKKQSGLDSSSNNLMKKSSQPDSPSKQSSNKDHPQSQMACQICGEEEQGIDKCGQCKLMYCKQHLRKYRKMGSSNGRVCDSCEDKNIFEAVTKTDQATEQNLLMVWEIVKLKHQEISKQIAAREEKYEATLLRKMKITESFNTKQNTSNRKIVRDLEKQIEVLNNQTNAVDEEISKIGIKGDEIKNKLKKFINDIEEIENAVRQSIRRCEKGSEPIVKQYITEKEQIEIELKPTLYSRIQNILQVPEALDHIKQDSTQKQIEEMKKFSSFMSSQQSRKSQQKVNKNHDKSESISDSDSEDENEEEKSVSSKKLEEQHRESQLSDYSEKQHKYVNLSLSTSQVESLVEPLKSQSSIKKQANVGIKQLQQIIKQQSNEEQITKNIEQQPKIKQQLVKKPSLKDQSNKIQSVKQSINKQQIVEEQIKKEDTSKSKGDGSLANTDLVKKNQNKVQQIKQKAKPINNKKQIDQPKDKSQLSSQSQSDQQQLPFYKPTTNTTQKPQTQFPITKKQSAKQQTSSAVLSSKRSSIESELEKNPRSPPSRLYKSNFNQAEYQKLERIDTTHSAFSLPTFITHHKNYCQAMETLKQIRVKHKETEDSLSLLKERKKKVLIKKSPKMLALIEEKNKLDEMMEQISKEFESFSKQEKSSRDREKKEVPAEMDDYTSLLNQKRKIEKEINQLQLQKETLAESVAKKEALLESEYAAWEARQRSNIVRGSAIKKKEDCLLF